MLFLRFLTPGIALVDRSRDFMQNTGVIASGTRMATKFVPKEILVEPRRKVGSSAGQDMDAPLRTLKIAFSQGEYGTNCFRGRSRLRPETIENYPWLLQTL